MKRIPLQETHIKLGAKMVDFAGYLMPVQYNGVTIEHETVRNSVGVFDVSHMGELLIEGPNALDLIQRVTSNDASKLKVGQAQYSYIPNETGGIVDDLIVYRLETEKYLLVVNASNIDKDWEWIRLRNTNNAIMHNLSEDYAMLAIQGPQTNPSIQSLTRVNLNELKFYHFTYGDFAGIENVIISATGYTGSGGFEIYCKNNEVQQIWDAVINLGIAPIGLAARDTLRLEMGYCLYGNDITESTSPIEAGLGWITKFNKAFTNSEALYHESLKIPENKLIGFKLEDRGIPRKGYDIVDGQGKKIGEVTSGTMSPTLGVGIGLGYVPTVFADINSKIYIQIRKHEILATVVKLPFYKK